MTTRARKPTQPPTAPHTPHIEVIARALILHRRRILVCRSTRRGYCYLPGGHVEFGEPAAAALSRELAEEAGLRIRVGPLLATGEETFTTRSRRHHEINLVFAASPLPAAMFHVEHPGQPPLVQSRETDIEFDWVALADLAAADFRPASILNWLTSGRRRRWLGR